MHLNLISGYPSTITNDDIIYEESLDHLQEEVAAGADFVITQMVFQAEMLISFIKQCRELGIRVPIIPGILPIQVSMIYYTISTQISHQGLTCRNKFLGGALFRVVSNFGIFLKGLHRKQHNFLNLLN